MKASLNKSVHFILIQILCTNIIFIFFVIFIIHTTLTIHIALLFLQTYPPPDHFFHTYYSHIPVNFLLSTLFTHPVLSTADIHTTPEVRPHYNNLPLSYRCMQQIYPEFHMHLLCPSVLHSQCSF